MPTGASSVAITSTTYVKRSTPTDGESGGHRFDRSAGSSRQRGARPRGSLPMARVVAPPRRALVFIGFMGAGKTTTALEVAVALGVQALDSDRLLEQELGHSIAAEFERNGEASFRAAEERLVCRLLDQAEPGSVLALGGGSVLSERVRAALE